MSRLFGPAIQLCYLSADLDATLNHWTQTLGVGPFFVLPARDFVSLQVDGAEIAPDGLIETIALGNTGDLQIEIIVPGLKESTYRRALRAGAAAPHHIGFAARDFEHQRALGVASGLTVEMEAQTSLTRLAYLRGESPGPLVELIEMNEGVESVFDEVRRASVGWSGYAPVRAWGSR